MRRNFHGNSNRNNGGNNSLHELDRELELLRRKRQLLEEQHQLNRLQDNQQALSPWAEPQERNFYDQPVQSYNQQSYDESSFSNNYAQLYSPRDSGSGNFGNRRDIRKRPANDISPWQDSPHPKRFINSTSRGGPRPNRGQDFNQTPKKLFGSKPSPRQPNTTGFRQQSTISPRTPQSNRAAPAKQGPTFNPSRVTKPKFASPAPNKLNSHPVGQRKALVSETVKSANLVDPKDLILEENKSPNSLVTGRLELALGTILKAVRDLVANGPNATLFSSTENLRILKQAIRARVRTAMLGKSVTNTTCIIEAYRAMYPPKTDSDFIKLVQDANKRGAKSKQLIKPVETGDFRTYVKHNMGRLLKLQLTEMFSKLKGMYEEEHGKSVTEMIEEITKITETIKESQDKSATDANGEGVPEEVQNGDKKDDSSETPVETVVNSETTVPEATEPESAEPIAAEATNEVQETKDDIAKDPVALLEESYTTLIIRLLQQRLQFILPRYIDKIVSILETDKNYTATKNAIMSRHTQRAGQETDSEVKAVEKKITPLADKEKFQTPLLYALVVGKPRLPRREELSKYLQTFNPLSIKKHKKAYNLLFVGVAEQADFDRLLAANGTVMSGNTLYIKVSERRDTKNPKADENETKGEKDEIKAEDAPTAEEGKDENETVSEDAPVAEDADAKVEDAAQTGDEQPEDNPIDSDTLPSIQESEETAADNEENGAAEENGNCDLTGEEEAAMLEENPDDKAAEVAEEVPAKATPARASARNAKATPVAASNVRTRRTSTRK